MRSTWLVCLAMQCSQCQSRTVWARWSVCVTICCVNPLCLDGQNVSPLNAHAVIMSRHILYKSMLSTCQNVSIHIVNAVIVSHHMAPMWSECIMIYCINLCCPHGQHVSVYIAHVVRVSHHMPYQFILSTWSDCITIYCPCGQSVSPYARVVRVSPPYAQVVSVYHHMPIWSECIPHNAHVVKVYPT